MTSVEFEPAITNAVQLGIVAGAACVAGRSDGTTFYEKAFGKVGAEADASTMELDTVMWAASCTKLLTSISALQCVERGLIDLESPISKTLADFTSPQILEGFDPETGKPILRTATQEITLRHLLTHSSGFGYIGMNPELTKYALDVHGELPGFTIDSPRSSTEAPLVFEPGQGWDYGVSLEWAGRMVEQVNGKISLGEYMQEHIFDVLGMSLTSFKPWDRPEMMKRMGGRAWRDAATGKVTVDKSGWFRLSLPSDRPRADYGGGGVFTCARDYHKVLMSLLLNDGKLLRPQTVEALFSPQLKDPSAFQALQTALATGPISGAATNGLPKGSCSFNYGLAGCLCTEGVPGHCGRGTLFWSGLPNSFWFIDREAGTCGVYVSHLFPPGDGPTMTLNAQFQRWAYSVASGH